MRILFLHPNFPGQFKHIAQALAANKKNDVAFLCRYPNKVNIPNVRKILYSVKQDKPAAETHRYLRQFEKANYAAQGAWRTLHTLEKDGYRPDVIVAHPGWGEGMFIKDIYPDVPYIAYMEFFYHAFGADIHFHPQTEINPDRVARTRIKNATHLVNLAACDWAISPTQWQASLHPKEFHSKFSVLHEGIDTKALKPSAKKVALTLPNGTKLGTDTPVLTYVARNFEPYRGFPQAMRSIALLMKEHPKLHVLMVGADDVSYGAKRKDGKSYREALLEENNIDPKRIHWLGALPYKQYLRVLEQSDVHLYLTVPFVLSWSLLEAMAKGCAIVASNTAPVKEAITHGKNGLLADFFDEKAIAETVTELLTNQKKNKSLRKAARKTIEERFSLEKILPLYKKLITDIAKGHVPPAGYKKLLPEYDSHLHFGRKDK